MLGRMRDGHEAIRNLLALYGERLDAGDFEGVGELFAQGALVGPDGEELARGREAVTEFYRRIVILHDGSLRTMHVTANTRIQIDEDSGTATARSAYLVYQAVDGPPVVIVTGRYDDRFARHEHGWCFAERRFSVELTGDLSRHLRM